MSGYGWHTVYDAEPTLAQYWVTVSCLTWAKRQTNNNPAFVFDLNRPKSLKTKQKTATRHTGTLERSIQQALVLTNVGPL